MDEKSFLYLLVLPSHGLIKIGKADDIYSRGQTLRRYWGEADYESSYEVSANRETVFRLERSLHFLLSGHAVDFIEGDGRTEIFSLPALQHAIKYVEMFSETGGVQIALKKGVKTPDKIAAHGKRPKPHKKLSERASSTFEDTQEILKRFHTINRLLIILMRRQYRVPYQYDYEGERIIFRVDAQFMRESELRKLPMLFSFSLEGFYGFQFRHCCSMTVSEGIAQFELTPPSEGEQTHSASLEVLLKFMFKQSEAIFKKLPRRSPALKHDLPVLDGAAVMDKIMRAVENSGG